jgi:hypothetical protein
LNDDAAGDETPFGAALRESLKLHGVRLEGFCSRRDAVARRVLEEYGAMFVASRRVRVPPVCVFSSEQEVLRFQEEATPQAEPFGEVIIELQPAAMQALVEAREEARGAGLDVTPRGGAEAGRRSFNDSLRLWNSRVAPALEHWRNEGRLLTEQCERLRCLSLYEQIAEVLKLETEGILFSKDFSKTILQSVAAPGSSQHLAMLAFDAFEYDDEHVRRILARHGWFQTVRSDLPHFTFLGLEEGELPERGLRRHVEANGQIFWTPDMGG